MAVKTDAIVGTIVPTLTQEMMVNTGDAVHSTQSCYYSIFTDSEINKTHSISSKLQRINFRSVFVLGSEVISFFFSLLLWN